MIVAKIARNIPLAIFMHYDTLLFYLTGVKYGFYPKNMASPKEKNRYLSFTASS